MTNDGFVDFNDPRQVHDLVTKHGHQFALACASNEHEREVVQRCFEFVSQEPRPSYLHSALCAMSLPTMRPKDDKKPVIREDGRYKLVITPKVHDVKDGIPQYYGVPYGAMARIALIYIMTEAVKRRSRNVYLGKSVSSWMKRLGYKWITGGKRGSYTHFVEQLKRLARCEWTIRYSDDTHVALKDVSLSNEQLFWADETGDFIGEIVLSEPFYNHLIEHPVPLNEVAIAHLKHNATALDLYTYLVYRLPRLERPTYLTWEQFFIHFGLETRNIRRFRMVIRQVLPQVLMVYPEAKIDVSSSSHVRLEPSPPVVPRKLIPVGIRLSSEKRVR